MSSSRSRCYRYGGLYIAQSAVSRQILELLLGALRNKTYLADVAGRDRFFVA